MIYFEHRSLFIHIPRTSGLSVARAVLSQKDPESTGMNVILGHGLGPFWRHAQAHILQKHIEEWNSPQLHKFTIIRNPWRICESTYRQFLLKRQQLAAGHCDWFDQEIKDILAQTAKQSFEDFVVSHFHYLRRGFFAHWGLEWETFRDLGVEALRFEDLDRCWPQLCELLQLPKSTIRPCENASRSCETLWTDRAIEFVQSRCALDFELFGYSTRP